MRSFFQNHKSEIIVGIVVFFITVAISQVGRWFLSAAPIIGASIQETFNNLVYSCAATQTNGQVLLLLFSVLIAYAAGKMVPPIEKEIGKFIEGKRQCRKTKRKKSEDTSRESRTEVHDTEEKKIRKSHSVLHSVWMAFLMIVSYLVFLFFVFKPLGLVDQFNRDITIVSPYVEEKTVLQFKSDWALMRSKADYDAIYESINRIKESNSLPIQ